MFVSYCVAPKYPAILGWQTVVAEVATSASIAGKSAVIATKYVFNAEWSGFFSLNVVGVIVLGIYFTFTFGTTDIPGTILYSEISSLNIILTGTL